MFGAQRTSATLSLAYSCRLITSRPGTSPGDDGEIHLTTRYRHGVRLAVPGNKSRVDLPIVVGVRDNGPGIPEDLRAHLFDPFVTTKVGGRGLGLALVAKIVGDHGGVIEFDGPTTYKSPPSVVPKWSPQDPGDIAPVGVGGNAAMLSVRRKASRRRAR